jgi:hypothetical protein
MKFLLIFGCVLYSLCSSSYVLASRHNKGIIEPKFDMYSYTERVGYIRFTTPSGGRGFCNIVLISEDLALTAKSCISGRPICKTAQAFFMADGGETLAGQYDCAKVRLPSKKEADFALIELDGSPGLYHGYVPLAYWSGLGGLSSTGGDRNVLWRIKYDPPTATKRDLSINTTVCKGGFGSKDKDKFTWVLKNEYKGENCHSVPGNNGGPLFDECGRLVGLVTSFGSKPGGSIGTGGAPSINLGDDSTKGPTMGWILDQFSTLNGLTVSAKKLGCD